MAEGSPGGRPGLRPEDLVVAIDGLPVRGVDDMHRLLTGDRSAEHCELTVMRNGGELTVARHPARALIRARQAALGPAAAARR